MEKEFNLSEKRKAIIDRFGILNGDHIAMLEEVLRVVEEQDKEFIQLLKEELWINRDPPTNRRMIKIIDKLAGDKLI